MSDRSIANTAIRTAARSGKSRSGEKPVRKGNVWPARAADARHAYCFALRAMWDPADVDIGAGRKMSEMRLRTALLQAVHLFRYFEPV